MATRLMQHDPYPKMDIFPGNVSSHIFAYNQPRLSTGACISVFSAQSPYWDNIVVLLWETNGSKTICCKIGAQKCQTASRLDRRQHAFPNYLQPWHDHWHLFNSIQVFIWSKHHIQLHKDDWNPKVDVPMFTSHEYSNGIFYDS